MPEELTDEVIKKKHKEFDDDLEKELNKLKSAGAVMPNMQQRLREAISKVQSKQAGK